MVMHLELIARRAYCVGTPLIFMFVCLLSVRLSVRPSVRHTQFRSGNPPKPLGGVSVRVQKLVRLGHLSDYRRNLKYRRKTCKWDWRLDLRATLALRV